MYSDMSMRTSAVLVVEQELRQRFGQLGLADAGRPQEHERADRPVRDPAGRHARAAHRGRNRPHGLGLTDHALADLLLHLKELFAASPSSMRSTGTPVQRDTTCAIWLAVTASSTLAPARLLALDVRELLLELGDAAIGKLAARAGIHRLRCAFASSIRN